MSNMALLKWAPMVISARRAVGRLMIILAVVMVLYGDHQPSDKTSLSSEPGAPVGNPGNWITYDDYPLKALREEQTGAVAFQLDYDEDGDVTTCLVTASSGYEILDQTTCKLLRKRAKFTPGQGPDGKPEGGKYRNRVRWELAK